MLARLARWLRLMGADVIMDPEVGGAAMLKRARAENRILLTRDSRLRTARDVLFLESNGFREQIRAVLARFPFDPLRRALSRCSRCNAELCRVGRDAVMTRVPPFVYASQEQFAECPSCGRIYWGATHPERMMRELDRIGI